MVEKTIANIVGELKKHDFIKGIVLGVRFLHENEQLLGEK